MKPLTPYKVIQHDNHVGEFYALYTPEGVAIDNNAFTFEHTQACIQSIPYSENLTTLIPLQ